MPESRAITDAELDHVAAPTPSSLGPVSGEERYAVMDVVRGFALFGVLAANMRGFNLPLSIYAEPGKLFHARADLWAQAALNIFISAKAYTLFAFLFGLGFAIQMSRAQARSAGFPWFYLRRLGALALFGLLHGILIWNGDILLPYAIGAFLLFWFRKAKLKTVTRWVVGIWGLGFLLVTTVWLLPRLPIHGHLGGNVPQPKPAETQQIIQTYAHAHLPGVVRETAFLWTDGHPPSHAHPWLWLQGSLPQDAFIGLLSFIVFVLGLWVWRRGVLQDFAAWRPRLKRICVVTLPLGLLCAIAAEIARQHHGAIPVPPPWWALPLAWAEAFGVPIFACGYATLLALLFSSGRWSGGVAWLAPAGRMALTNYLMQSIVCVVFYSGMVTGLYGRVGPAWDMAATVALYSAQVAVSHWWMARFRFGPAEWLWRTMTYGARPAMRVARG